MKLEEVEMKLTESAFRVDRAVCPHCNLKMHKTIENKSLFEGALTFHIIKLKCEKCSREYMDLEQAQVYDLFLAVRKLKEKPIYDVAEKISQQIILNNRRSRHQSFGRE
ncbi:MAG: hypothetical protein HYW24_03485 [Candidatus Aenigmarchaeota archaeon]|nr:hypothetical protein [Candidatus Aenigmarchaeota archaeon]